jgi:nondiscriminating glutamyl-tRNA synthetase
VSSTPKHIILYNYFGWEAPNFTHLPLLLNPDKSKLSKRQGDISIQHYHREGILPAALLNFVALLGWSPKETNREIMTLEEMISGVNIKFIFININKVFIGEGT